MWLVRDKIDSYDARIKVKLVKTAVYGGGAMFFVLGMGGPKKFANH
jgi:hypothetical protein